MRASWFVERIARGASSPHWRAERMNLSEVLQDLVAAKEADDHFRFLAPWFASDEELDVLLRRGAMPTFPALKASDVDILLSELIAKKPKPIGGAS
jgi:hypothetical protein